MLEENKTGDNKAGGKAAGDDEITLESLQETIASQAGLIQTLKDESANNVVAMRQFVEDNYGKTNADMQNLMSLIGGLAGDGQQGQTDEELDITDPKEIERLVDKKLEADRKAKAEADKKANDAYMDDYVAMLKDDLDEELMPDGNPLTPEARKGIMDLLKTTFVDKYTKNGTRDAAKNLSKAKARYFGRDKTHGFKGSDARGTGVGGSSNTESSGHGKKAITLTEESKKLLADLGETEEWAKEKLEAAGV